MISFKSRHNLFNRSTPFVTKKDQEGYYIYVSPNFERLTGYNQEDLIGKCYEQFIHPDDLQFIVNGLKKAYIEQTNSTYRFKCQNGQYIWLNTSFSLIEEDSIPSSKEFICISREVNTDIDYQKENNYESMPEQVNEVVVVHDFDGTVFYISPNCEQMNGYKPSEIIGMKHYHYVHPEDYDYLVETFKLTVKYSVFQKIEIRYRRKDNSYLWVELLFQPIKDSKTNQVNEVICNIRDIGVVKEQQQERDLLLQHSIDAVCLIVDGKVQHINEYGMSLLEVSDIQDVLGRDIIDFIPERFKEQTIKRLNQIIIDGKVTNYMERMIYTIRGNIRFIEARAIPRLYNGHPAIQYIIRDRTEQKEKELRIKQQQKIIEQSETFYRHLIDELPEAILITQNNRIVYANDPALRMFDADNPRQLIFNNKSDFLIEEISHPKAFKPTDPKDLSQFSVRKYQTLKGNTLLVEEKHIETYFKHEKAMIISLRDITNKQKYEDLLLQSEKLTVAGQLAAGIAHEIRNPITSIKGFIQLIKKGGINRQEFYDIIFDEIERIEEITGELLVLAKPHVNRKEVCDLSELLQEVIVLLNSQARLKNIGVHTRFTNLNTTVKCDRTKIKQVFINIIKNAIEAMEIGEIMVSLDVVNENAIVKIIDEGPGIPESQISKLGDPFFTTKEKGTGLGLSICFKIIENHSGTIEVESKEHHGTTFTITLPLEKLGLV